MPGTPSIVSLSFELCLSCSYLLPRYSYSDGRIWVTSQTGRCLHHWYAYAALILIVLNTDSSSRAVKVQNLYVLRCLLVALLLIQRAFLVEHQYFYHYGERCAQLDSDHGLPSAGSQSGSSLLFTVLNIISFFTAASYCDNLRRVWIDKGDSNKRWKSFVSQLQDDWLAAITPVRGDLLEQIGRLTSLTGNGDSSDERQLLSHSKRGPEWLSSFETEPRANRKLCIDCLQHRKHHLVSRIGSAVSVHLTFRFRNPRGTSTAKRARMHVQIA